MRGIVGEDVPDVYPQGGIVGDARQQEGDGGVLAFVRAHLTKPTRE